MIKILLISHIFPPAIDGGSRVIYKLGQYLETQNHQTLYLSSDCSSTDDFTKPKYLRSDKLTTDQLKLPVYHHLRRPLKFINLFIPKKFYLHQLLQIAQKGPIFKIFPFIMATIQILKFKPDLIIAGPLPTTIILYANFFKFITKVLMFQRSKVLINSSFHQTDPDFQQLPLIKTLQHTDYLWTLTQYETDYFIKKFKINPNKIILAGNGIDESFLKKSKVPRLVKEGARGRLNILFIGSLSAHKRVDLLIKSFSTINNLRSTKLVIAGQKTLYYPKIQKQIKKLPKSVQSKIKFIFNFPQKNLSKLIDSCDLLVLPSIQESFGLVLIESWARGKPVLVSNIPSLSELVTQTNGGLIFNQDDPVDLKNKMEKLIKSPKLCYQLGQNGYNYVKNNYTWSIVGKKICQKISLLE